MFKHYFLPMKEFSSQFEIS